MQSGNIPKAFHSKENKGPFSHAVDIQMQYVHDKVKNKKNDMNIFNQKQDEEQEQFDSDNDEFSEMKKKKYEELSAKLAAEQKPKENKFKGYLKDEPIGPKGKGDVNGNEEKGANQLVFGRSSANKQKQQKEQQELEERSSAKKQQNNQKSYVPKNDSSKLTFTDPSAINSKSILGTGSKVDHAILTLNSDNKELREQLIKVQSQPGCSRHQSELNSQKNELHRLDYQIAEKDRIIEMLMKQVEQFEQRIKSCKPILKEIEKIKIKEVKYRDEARIKELIDELNRLRDQHHLLQEEYESLKNRNNELQDENAQLKEQLEECYSMKSQTTTIISEITTWKNKYEEITKDDQQLIIDLKKIDEDLEELRKKKKEEQDAKE